MQSLERVMALIEAVAAFGKPLGVTDAAHEVGLPLSTTSRIMRSLAEAGVLEKSAEGGSYSLGVRLIAVAALASSQGGPFAASTAAMTRLRNRTQETVSLHIRSGRHRVCFAEVQSEQEIRRVIGVGRSLPLYAGATGQVLLAGLQPHEIDEYVASLQMEAGQERDLRQNIKEVAGHGWATATDSLTAGVSGVAAPIKNQENRTVASLTVSGPSSRLTTDKMHSHLDDLMKTAERIGSLYFSSGDTALGRGINDQ